MNTSEPHVVFHATNHQFDVFETPAWFAFAREDAKVGGEKPGAYLISALLDVQNPCVLDDAAMAEFLLATGVSTARANAWAERFLEAALEEGHDALEMPGYAVLVADSQQICMLDCTPSTSVKADGNDGPIARNDCDGTVSDHFIVFSPHQIKSTIGDTRAHDPSNPNITDSQAAAGKALDFLSSLAVTKKAVPHA